MKAKAFALTVFATITANFIENASSKLSLPDPSGVYKVRTVEMKLIDHNRVDPYAPDSQKRALMIQVYYPTSSSDHYLLASYMPAATAQFENRSNGLPNNTLQSIQTQAHLGAPIAHSNPPIVLFSTALATTRYLYTSLLSDIASRGYLVVSIDHPYDADIVEFPDGKMVTGILGGDLTLEQINAALDVRSRDASFVLDQLNTFKLKKKIPGLCKQLDVRRVVMLGHSLGGAAAAAAMLNDTRIVAGANLDGSFRGAVVNQGLDRPFLIMSRMKHDRSTDPSWAEIWPNLRSWRLELKLADSEHYTYSDMPVLANILNITSPALTERIGIINGLRSLVIQSTYVSAFLEYIFGRTIDPILQRPDSRFPEITFEN